MGRLTEAVREAVEEESEEEEEAEEEEAVEEEVVEEVAEAPVEAVEMRSQSPKLPKIDAIEAAFKRHLLHLPRSFDGDLLLCRLQEDVGRRSEKQ